MYPELPSISYEGFDLIAVASKKYAKELAENGFRTTYIPQGTNTSLFKHKPQKNGIDLLFVGSRHSEDDYRPSVKYAIQNDFPVHVYGIRWEGHISPKYLKGNFISNNDLHKYYSSAKIILNDHRQDMREAGFVANRIFDVTASQGFIISDYMPEIEEIYGDSIPMWHNEVEFKNLVNYYLNHPEERAKKSQKAHKITMKNYTIDAIGARFEEEIKKLFQERKSKN